MSLVKVYVSANSKEDALKQAEDLSTKTNQTHTVWEYPNHKISVVGTSKGISSFFVKEEDLYPRHKDYVSGNETPIKVILSEDPKEDADRAVLAVAFNSGDSITVKSMSPEIEGQALVDYDNRIVAIFLDKRREMIL
tara:strand:+ start:2059 stop:2469 length:411 start_codon:yes stop_codon:yes gene_type:complete